MKKFLMLLVTASLIGLIAFRVAGATTRASDGPTANATVVVPQPGQAICDDLNLEVDGEVTVRFWFGMLPTTASGTGVHQRPVAVQACFVRGVTLLARSSTHRLITGDSVEVLDFSVSGLDVNLADPSAPATTVGRAYTVRVSPRPGTTWGSVASLNQLQIEVVRTK